MDIIDRTNPQKLYLQLYEVLKDKIEKGIWKINDQIPTEKDLCDEYDVSKATVRLALSELERHSYIKRLQGKGTFVCKRDINYGISILTSFKKSYFEESVKFSTRVLAQTVMMPINDIDNKLSISRDKHIIYIKRLRFVDTEPVLLQETFMPHFICPEILEQELASSSLIELVEKLCKKNITKAEDYISIESANKEDSELLAISNGSPILLIEQFLYEGQQKIAYIRIIKRPDKFKFFIELKRIIH